MHMLPCLVLTAHCLMQEHIRHAGISIVNMHLPYVHVIYNILYYNTLHIYLGCGPNQLNVLKFNRSQ